MPQLPSSHAQMTRRLDVPSNSVTATSSIAGLHFLTSIECSHYSGSFNLCSPYYCYFNTMGTVMNCMSFATSSKGLKYCAVVLQGLTVGTGSVSGFVGLAAGGRRYPLGVLTEQLDSYWNQACVFMCGSVYISGKGIFFSFFVPLVDTDGLDEEPKQASWVPI